MHPRSRLSMFPPLSIWLWSAYGPAPTEPCDGFRASPSMAVLSGRLFSFHEKQLLRKRGAGSACKTQVVNEIQVE